LVSHATQEEEEEEEEEEHVYLLLKLLDTRRPSGVHFRLGLIRNNLNHSSVYPDKLLMNVIV
jgi:hypothetical protein